MVTIDSIFDQYIELRLRGKELDAVYAELRDDVVNNLSREDRNTLSVQCDRWERDRTQPDISRIQREAMKRAHLSNITLQIVFCPACDTPNGGGVTRCQVCNEPLGVTHQQSTGTTGITGGKKGVMFDYDSQLILQLANSNDRLVLQPQISPAGLKLGRNTEVSSCDVDLSTIGGDDYGVSRMHAVIRYDRNNSRLVIIDNYSTNGTMVNGVRIPPDHETVLGHGDEIKLARMVFQVKYK